MSVELFDEDRELSAHEAFLLSLDEAIQTTVRCLSSAGAGEDEIWTAFHKAINTIQNATADVDECEFMERQVTAKKAA